MSHPSELIYVALRKQDAEGGPYAPSFERECAQCHTAVIVDRNMIRIADNAQAIVCAPCAQELTGKSITKLFKENVDDMIDVMKKDLDDHR
jgi:hypothetical protein